MRVNSVTLDLDDRFEVIDVSTCSHEGNERDHHEVWTRAYKWSALLRKKIITMTSSLFI